MTGERGRDGAVGAEGRAGTTGTPGAPGVAGATGKQGARGRSGGRDAAVAFLIILSFCFMGFVRIEQFNTRSIEADREGCGRDNVLRNNQARVLLDQIEATDRTLKGKLNGLERFRSEIEAGQLLRKQAVQRLRVSARDYPVRGKPFTINCSAAYP